MLCGIQLSRAIAHHPAANGVVERFHQTLRETIMCHAGLQRTEVLPLVLLGIRTISKDSQESIAKLVYGEPLRITGELLTSSADPVDIAYLIA
jgi:cleavage and polyadenylation specificity factor subunit 1